MQYFYLSHCRDFRVLSAQLNEDEMEKAEELVQGHYLGVCKCEENADGFHCLAGRWIEGLIDTGDFLDELTSTVFEKRR